MAAVTPDRQVLEAILTKKKNIQFEFMALQIFISRCIRGVEEKPETLDQRVKQFQEFIERYMVFPELRKDLDKMA